jgi:hypothetical protein
MSKKLIEKSSKKIMKKVDYQNILKNQVNIKKIKGFDTKVIDLSIDFVIKIYLFSKIYINIVSKKIKKLIMCIYNIGELIYKHINFAKKIKCFCILSDKIEKISLIFQQLLNTFRRSPSCSLKGGKTYEMGTN